MSNTPKQLEAANPISGLEATSFFKALSDETRLGILLLLIAENELCVCELTEALQQSQPKISRHLALLRENNLLSDRRQGIWVYYQINPALPAWALQTLSACLDENQHLIQASQQRLHNMGNRPERQANCC